MTVLDLPVSILKALKILRDDGIEAGVVKVYGTTQYVIALPTDKIQEKNDNRPAEKVHTKKH